MKGSRPHRDNNSKVPVERPRYNGFGVSADVGFRSELVGLWTVIARSKGDRRRERHPNKLSQVQMTS